MESAAADIARRLGREAEAVCRHYLSNGRRQGRYWIVGDAANTPGRSLYVRLVGPSSGPGAAGKWTDAATGEHGDLLDLITLNLRLASLGDALDEARRFLSLPQPEPPPRTGDPHSPDRRRRHAGSSPWPGRSPAHWPRPICEDAASSASADVAALRFHPNCYYWREDHADDAEPEAWPALLAKVTDLDGAITGVHRTWIDPTSAQGAGRATAQGNGQPARQRCAHRQGHRACWPPAKGSRPCCRCAWRCPTCPWSRRSPPAISPRCTSLRNSTASTSPSMPTRPASWHPDKLADRAEADGVEAIRLSRGIGDFNEDLRALGLDELRAHLRPQLAPADVDRLLPSSGG